MDQEFLPEGAQVFVHSLGATAPYHYRGIIRGIASEYAGGCIYIVEMIDKFDPNNNYSCCTIPSGCIRPNNGEIEAIAFGKILTDLGYQVQVTDSNGNSISVVDLLTL